MIVTLKRVVVVAVPVRPNRRTLKRVKTDVCLRAIIKGAGANRLNRTGKALETSTENRGNRIDITVENLRGPGVTPGADVPVDPERLRKVAEIAAEINPSLAPLMIRG